MKTRNEKKRAEYEAPTIEVIELLTESYLLTNSGQIGDIEPGGGWGTNNVEVENVW